MRDFQIEHINYDLIRKAINLSEIERNKLYGFSDKYIAARPQGNGYYVLMNTIGKRDECARSLRRYFRTNPMEKV